MAEPVKRVHYFDHQFLREVDFTAEQNYHMKMRRLHNSLLHTWGIAEGGLDLSFASGASRADIREGVAVDGEGQEIVLVGNTQTEDLSGFAEKTVYVTIAYGEEKTDSTSETGVQGYRRWEEKPLIEVAETAPTDPSKKLILGRVTLDSDGKITRTDEGEGPNRRRAAGVVGGDLEVRSLALTDPTVVSTQWPRMRLLRGQVAVLDGSLTVSESLGVVGRLDGLGGGTFRDLTVQGLTIINGAVGIGQATPAQKLDVAGTVKATAFEGTGLNITNNATVGGTLIVTGNVGIGQATPTQKLDVAGTVKATAFQGNGAQLTNVNDATKVLKAGDTMTGQLRITAAGRGLHVTGDVLIDGNLRAGSIGGPNQLINQLGEALEQGTDVTKVAKAGDTMTGPLAITAAGTGLSISNNAAVGGSLHVAGDVNIDGTLTAHKIGYVADRFLNPLGEALEQGDVVVIGENQASLYYGPENSVPIPEVDTTERAYDRRVCGIVSEVLGEVTSVAREQANPGARRRRSSGVPGVRSFTLEERVQLNRTQVQPRQIGGMVTLGAYAYCKVDADIAPIEVGDLLTTSPTKGHAQKVVDPSQGIGAILGKALGALKSGQGKIPVLVMLQ